MFEVRYGSEADPTTDGPMDVGLGFIPALVPQLDQRRLFERQLRFVFAFAGQVTTFG
jgi:hypothetical protein